MGLSLQVLGLRVLIFGGLSFRLIFGGLSFRNNLSDFAISKRKAQNAVLCFPQDFAGFLLVAK